MTREDRLQVLREAFTDALVSHWRRVAEGYSHRGDVETAKACRARAAVLLMWDDDPEVVALLSDPEVVGDLAIPATLREVA